VECPTCENVQQFEFCSICDQGVENCDHDHENGANIIEKNCPECGGGGIVDAPEEEG
jgi:hypothetical protein